MSSQIFFMKALESHLEYLKNIQQNINGESDYCGTNHLSCPFGKWLHSEAAIIEVKSFGKKAEAVFQQLFELHEKFHYVSDNSIKAFNRHDHVLAKRSLTEMIFLSNKLIKLLLELSDIADKK